MSKEILVQDEMEENTMHNVQMKKDAFSAIDKCVWRNLAPWLRQCGALIAMLIVLFAGSAEAYAAPVKESVKLVKAAGPFAVPVAIVLVVIGVAEALMGKVGKKGKGSKYSRVGVGVVAPEEIRRIGDAVNSLGW